MNTSKIERKFDILRTFVSIAIALGLALIVVAFISDDPFDTIQKFLLGPMSSQRRMFNVIELMIPLIFTGVAMCIVQQAAMINLIADGAFYIAASFATYIALNTTLPVGIHPIFILIISMIVGGLCGMIPAVLKVKWKANEVVSSIMMNYVLAFLGLYILNYHMKDISVGFNASFELPESAKLPIILPKTRLHFGIFIVLAVVVLSYFLLYKSKWGYEMRMTGENANFARYSGINVKKVILYASFLSGAIAGLGGGTEILGMYSRFQWEKSPGYGWDGIMVAILAKNNPALVPLAAFFLAYLRIGADILSRDAGIPVEFASVIQGLIIILIAAEMFLSGLKHKAITKESQKMMAKQEGGN